MSVGPSTKCTELANYFQSNNFSVDNLLTVLGSTGYQLSVKIGEGEREEGGSFYVSLINSEVGRRDSGNYAFNEGHSVMDVTNESLARGCFSWKLDPQSHLAVSKKVTDFIEDQVNEFVALRDRAQFTSVAKAPVRKLAEIRDVVNLLGTTLVMDKLAVSGEVKEGERITEEDYQKVFADVGLEYVRDEVRKKFYVIIYKHVEDKKARVPPKFIVVYEQDKIRNSIKMIMFIHNFNEDSGLHFLIDKPSDRHVKVE